MIKFTLCCARGHEFQSWFQSGEAFDAQAKAGLVACPICRAREVTKAIMAPAIASRAGAKQSGPRAKTEPHAPVALLNKHDLETRAMINSFRKRVFEEAEDVGTRFPEEARKIHDGLVPERPIHGQASYGDARALIEEGVAILPFPPALDELN
ncbi:MAG: DUF1178 family protein [Beijerinckiaceae bacterium]|nr:DUF1178 family protein [Beijerinckiaceae bacterium]